MQELTITIDKDGNVTIEGGDVTAEGAACLTAVQPFLDALGGDAEINPLVDPALELDGVHAHVTE